MVFGQFNAKMCSDGGEPVVADAEFGGPREGQRAAECPVGYGLPGGGAGAGKGSHVELGVVCDHGKFPDGRDNVPKNVSECRRVGYVVGCDAVDADIQGVETFKPRRGRAEPGVTSTGLAVGVADDTDLADGPPVIVGGFHVNGHEIEPGNERGGFVREFAVAGAVDHGEQRVEFVFLVGGESDGVVHPAEPRPPEVNGGGVPRVNISNVADAEAGACRRPAFRSSVG